MHWYFKAPSDHTWSQLLVQNHRPGTVASHHLICASRTPQSGALLVYDITRRSSFDRLAQWLMDARQNAQPKLGGEVEGRGFGAHGRAACSMSIYVDT